MLRIIPLKCVSAKLINTSRSICLIMQTDWHRQLMDNMGLGSKTCTSCSGIDTVTKSISNNNLSCLCSRCGCSYTFSLLKIIKKIFYLDQNFLSNAYKNKSTDFSKRADRIHRLAKQQLIICPFSDAHDQEAHLFRECKQLLGYIRNISRNKRFYPATKIMEQQLINAYYSFLNNEPNKSELILSNAIAPCIHDWDNSFRFDMLYSISDFMPQHAYETSKINFVNKIIGDDVLPQWRKSQSSFANDFTLEVRDHAIFLIRGYYNSILSVDIQTILESEECRIINTLLTLNAKEIDMNDRMNSVIAFLKSKHFENVPYINTAAGLWAQLKKEIKQRQFLTEQTKIDNINKQTRGLPADIEHLSVFAPYCDAIFTERRMARYLREWQNHELCSLCGDNSRVFSIDNWSEFDLYLDEIEENATSDMKDELNIVFGG